MIIIGDFGRLIMLPDNQSYAIYSKDYVDEKSEQAVDSDSTSQIDREYCDIYICTGNTKYVFKKSLQRYECVYDIIQYIQEHIEDKIIFINTYDLFGDVVWYEEFEIETID